MRNLDKNSYKNIEIHTTEQQEQLARLWSEGNEYLYDLLIFCMKNNIKTVACCAGHKESGDTPYIGFDMDDPKTKYIILQLMSHMFSKAEDIDIIAIGISTNTSVYLQNSTDGNDEFFKIIKEEFGEEKTLDYRAQKMLFISEIFKSNNFMNLSETSHVEICYNASHDEVKAFLDISPDIRRGIEKMSFDDSLNIINLMEKDIFYAKRNKNIVISPLKALKEGLKHTPMQKSNEADSVKSSGLDFDQDKDKDKGVTTND